MAELLILGSAPGFPTPERGHSSAVLDTGKHRILIDAGEPCSRSMLAHGLQATDIDAVLLTHGHSDHTAGLPMLIQTAWISGRTKALPIYLPKELIDPLQAWLDASYIGPRFLQFPLEFLAWESGPSLEQFELSVVPQATSHLEDLVKQFGPTRFHAYSLRIAHPDFQILLSGDLGSPRDLDPQLREPPGLTVCELAHFESEELFGYLRGKNIPRLLLTHLAPKLSSQSDQLLALAREYLPETRTLVANDGMRIRI
jgi:ribonuclease Z